MTGALHSSTENGVRAGLVEMTKRLLRVRETGLIAIIVVLCVVMSFASPYFLTWTNLRAMTLVFAVEGIVVIGMTILLIAGGTDLSVGSVTALAMVIAGWLFSERSRPLDRADNLDRSVHRDGRRDGVLRHESRPAPLHRLAGGDGHRPRRLAPACWEPVVVRRGSTPLPPEFKFIGQGSVGPIPVIIIVFIVFVVAFDFLVRRTTMFRRVFYTGSNEKAAAYSGIRTKKVIVLTTTLCSALCGVAGIIFMSRFGSAQPTFEIGMELNAIAAAVIGDASLSGGTGSIFGAILGAILLSVVSGSLTLLDVSVYWQDIIRGSILLAAVSFDHYFSKRRTAA